MGLMENPADRGQLVVTPHPVTLDGQRIVPAEIVPGETLGDLLRRSVPDWSGDCWEVRINGVLVPYEVMDRVRPKDGALIEARGVVKRSALSLVAFAALTYWTMGAFSALGTAGGTVFGLSGVAGYAAVAGVYAAGSLLINKVLGPKLPGASASGQQADPVHSISASRNRMRQYEPAGLLFGSVRVAPDMISQPYTRYEGEEQYLGMILTPGINVDSIDELYLGDALLSSFEGVEVWHSGFPGMPEQPIPLYSNADTIAGGELETNGDWVQRTTSAGTVQVQIDIEGLLYDVGSEGEIFQNNVPVIVQYRAVGDSQWSPGAMQVLRHESTSPVRRTISFSVAEGQYDVRVRVGQPEWHDGTPYDECRLSWTWMRSIQPDDATYSGLPRIGIKMRASGQLNGTPDEIRCVAHSQPVPVWNGSQWVTQRTSNPGAQILAYARGINSGGERVAGMGLSDDMIDIAAWQAFMLHCAANGYTYDWWITDARSHDDVMNTIARAGFGQVTWAGGRLSVVWAADEQPLSGVVNMATIKRGQFQVDYTLANAADGVEVTYYDAATWEAQTLRIPAPGITTMLNPAQLQLEGVTSEERAAEQGRFHLAQSLYQYKDISFSTDLEHLSYRRMSLLSLQHDLTQWGFGGRIRGASIVGGVVSLELDEPVPPPSSGSAYIGLRIPGERVYRVFPVASFSEPTDTIRLVGAWPNDAPLPGHSDANPAHDTIWIYDFKQTPGYRVRVVQIEPESGMSGARVAVVPESPEYWTYVKTGEYIPAPGGSQLETRPVASNLQITEQQIKQGDTVYTELTATFDISGPVGDTRVLADNGDGIMREVARTSTRTATWRIPRAGTYTISVRPYSPEGVAGVAASIIYSTLGADAPPVLVDLFEVEQIAGGLRFYSWGWLSETIQSADFAGVEIRYIEGEVETPTWANMTPLGETGYFTAPFEATIPEAGTWTFACRSRNTSGTLSTGMRVVTRTLESNLGQVIDDITAEQVAQREKLDQEILDRAQEDLRYAQQAAADATAKANAARDAALAQVDALAAEVAEITGAPEWDAGATYEAGWLVKFDGALYRALVQTTGDQPDMSPAAWEKIGDYTSVAEVAAAALQMATVNASELEAVATQLSAITARMPAGQGALATQAMVADQASVLVNQIEALAQRTQLVEARMPAGAGPLATAARVSEVEQASADRDTALGQRVGNVEATLPDLATNARVTDVEQASVSRDSALASRTQAMESRMPAGSGALATAAALSSTQTQVQQQGGQINALAQNVQQVSLDLGGTQASVTQLTEVTASAVSGNAVINPSFEDSGGWQFGSGMVRTESSNPGSGGWILRVDPGASPAVNNGRLVVATVDDVRIGAKVRFGVSPNQSSAISLVVHFYRRNGSYIQSYTYPIDRSRISSEWQVFTRAWRKPLEAYFATAVVTQQALASGSYAIDDVFLSPITTDVGALRARHTVSVNANGHWVGTVTENDGERGGTTFLMDYFRVLSPGAAEGMEWQANYLRIYGSGYQLVMGTRFGASNNLVYWFGPNVGANNCTTSNCIECKTSAGATIIRGSNAQGTMEITNTLITLRNSNNAMILRMGAW